MLEEKKLKKIKIDGFDLFIHTVFEDFILVSKSEKREKLYPIRTATIKIEENDKTNYK